MKVRDIIKLIEADGWHLVAMRVSTVSTSTRANRDA
jgi:predicted RNA binding protein YcfA (HicA-like mRNA interferase family)